MAKKKKKKETDIQDNCFWVRDDETLSFLVALNFSHTLETLSFKKNAQVPPPEIQI